jgi:hypothetical protein
MKISAKHTPGPWIQKGNAIFRKLDSGLTEKIATVHGGKFGNPHPNACLIAAAPELLEAAKLAAKLCKLITQWANAEQPVSYFIMDKIVYLAQDNVQPAKAIAKAEGR